MKGQIFYLLTLLLSITTINSIDGTVLKNTLLNGITTLPKIGYPGKVISYGNNSLPIVVGDQGDDILVAAAQLGTGRIVVMTHSGYLTNFTSTNTDASVKKLQDNIKSWVTKGKFTSNTQMIHTDEYIKLSGTPSYLLLYTTENR